MLTALQGMAAATGHNSDELLTKLSLKFDRKIALRVYDEFADNISEDSQGNLYVRADLPDNEILYSYIMSFSNCAEIIDPSIYGSK